MLLDKQNVNNLLSAGRWDRTEMFSILCVVPIFLFYFSWVQRFLFIKGLELMTVVRCSDRCKIKGTFGEFPTAQCFLQFDSDILPNSLQLCCTSLSAQCTFLLTSEGIILCSESTEPTFHLHFQASSSRIWRRSSELLSSEPWIFDLQIFKSSTQRTLIQSLQSSESWTFNLQRFGMCITISLIVPYCVVCQ